MGELSEVGEYATFTVIIVQESEKGYWTLVHWQGRDLCDE
jgi:hypothetical protein